MQAKTSMQSFQQLRTDCSATPLYNQKHQRTTNESIYESWQFVVLLHVYLVIEYVKFNEQNQHEA